MSAARQGPFFRSRRPLVLASGSPRRVALLRQVGAAFTVADPGPDRAWPGNAEPQHGVRALALDKARRVAERRRGAVIVAADTVVVARGLRLGKPADVVEAAGMLRRLQGRTHEVWSGIAALWQHEERTASECTRVTFAKLDEEEIESYLRLGESMDKAGAYAIQGAAAQFVTRIEGDWANVVGLPLAKLRRLLLEFTG